MARSPAAAGWRCPISLCILVLSISVFTSVSADSVVDWPMLRGDVRRSGLADPVGADSLQVAWAAALGLSVDSSPAVVGGRVYVGSDDGMLSCLRADDGEVLWQARTEGAVVSSAAVHQGVVYVGSSDRCLYAFDAEDGRSLWRLRTWRPVIASPLVLDGRVYIGSMDGGFRCVDAETGRIIWEHEGGPFSASAAAGEDGIIFCGDEEGNFWARRAETGEQVWTATMDGAVIRAPLVAGDYLVVGVMAPSALRAPRINHLLVLDRRTGKQIWARNGQSSVLHSPVADDDTVYYSTVSGYTSATEMFAARLRDGDERWKIRLAGVADSSPALSGDRLLFGLHDSHFHVVDKRSGRVIQRLDIGAKIYSSPAVVGGRVYFGAGDGKLYCLH